MSFLTSVELKKIGFKFLGENVRISSKASIYGASKISIGDNTRIDDFCVLSAGEGGIEIGKYVHIAVYSSLIGRGKISIGNFSNISSRVSIYSSNDDYSGAFMTNPTIPEEFTNVTHALVEIKEHVIIGCGTVILPGVTLEDGVAIGALSLVNCNCEANKIYAGLPVKKIKNRKLDYLSFQNKL